MTKNKTNSRDSLARDKILMNKSEICKCCCIDGNDNNSIIHLRKRRKNNT